MYFNYHAKIKKLISNNQLIGYKFFYDYNGIKPALVLYFKNNSPMPVREHKFEEYLKIIKQKNIKEID